MMALDGESVLLLAGDVELLGHVLGGDAIVAHAQRPGEDVDDAILEGLVAHAGAPTGFAHIIGQLRDVFHADATTTSAKPVWISMTASAMACRPEPH